MRPLPIALTNPSPCFSPPKPRGIVFHPQTHAGCPRRGGAYSKWGYSDSILLLTIEHKINPTWNNICQKRNIPKHIRRTYISNNTTLPYYYHLIKTHKLDLGIKIGSIVSNTNGPTTRLSWLLARTLKPLLKQVQLT